MVSSLELGTAEEAKKLVPSLEVSNNNVKLKCGLSLPRCFNPFRFAFLLHAVFLLLQRYSDEDLDAVLSEVATYRAYE
jgi:membrane-associated PAP2 superfamily phosphatase